MRSAFAVVLLGSLHFADAAKPPNIIFILADDLGFGDYEASPSSQVIPPVERDRIRTPHIKAMANAGLVFDTSYSGPICAPSRCTLMSGKHMGHCSIRGNDGSYSPMPEGELTVARLLSTKAGYVTGLVGKWGEGDHGTSGYPLAAGFDEFIGQDTQVGCHNWYPSSSTPAGGALWNMSTPLLLPENNGASYETCGEFLLNCTWANDLYQKHALSFIRKHAHGPKPFFLYLSTTTPHVGYLGNHHNNKWPVPLPLDSDIRQFLTKPWPAVERNFSAAVWSQDVIVGAVNAELDTLGIKNNTVLFFSGPSSPLCHSVSLLYSPPSPSPTSSAPWYT
jgi:uncharacterized sulfatase